MSISKIRINSCNRDTALWGTRDMTFREKQLYFFLRIAATVCYIRAMASALDRQLNKLESIVEKFCIEGKEEDAIECVEWARGYADDFPQDEDIQEAIKEVRQVGKYITAEGKPQYEKVREALEKELRNLL